MKEISVSYLLDDSGVEGLKAISDAYKGKGLDLSLEDQFSGIMRCGSKFDIDKKR